VFKMGAALSQYTTMLANSLCGGSSRKLIAGWWYSILGLTGSLMLMSVFLMGTRSFSEGFTSTWSALLLLLLTVGGTMIMRKFHNSMAVGFLMGAVISMSQLFFLLFLLYIGYGKNQAFNGHSYKGESMMSLLCLIQSVLLGSFAAILGAHRSEILDKPGSAEHMQEFPSVSYDPPSVT